jgi:DNA-binding response OmpR family regulator
LTTLHIGVIDDDRNVLYQLEKMAEEEDWRFFSTVEPEEALGWVKDDEVDLLLMDVWLPVASGLQLIRKARGLSEKVVLIGLSEMDKENVASRLLLAGADDFILKPLRMPDFRARLRLHEKLVNYRDQLNWDIRKKGISIDTMREIIYCVKRHKGPMDCDAVAAASGLAYVTAHRYLDFLADRGMVVRLTASPDGRPGRPKTFYEWKGGL